MDNRVQRIVLVQCYASSRRKGREREGETDLVMVANRVTTLRHVVNDFRSRFRFSSSVLNILTEAAGLLTNCSSACAHN